MSKTNIYANLLLNAIKDQDIELIKQIFKSKNLFKNEEIKEVIKK